MKTTTTITTKTAVALALALALPARAQERAPDHPDHEELRAMLRTASSRSTSGATSMPPARS